MSDAAPEQPPAAAVNVAAPMGRRALLLPSLALASILNILNNDWIYASLFFYTHPAWQVAATLLIPALAVLAFAAALSTVLRPERVVRFLDVVTLVVVAFFLYSIGRRNGHLAGNMPVLGKLALALAIVGLAYFASRRLSRGVLWRLRVAVVFGCVMFLLSPEVLLPIEHTFQVELGPFFHANDPAKPKTNTVILVLDELSDLKDSPVEAALRAGGRPVLSRAVVSSGADTISAIPALLASVPMEGDRPCTPTALCADRGLFDFARQNVERPNVNVVGFFHPYCEMKGLVYCRQVSVFGAKSVVFGFGCNLMQQAAIAGIRYKPEACERQWLDAGRARAARAEVDAAVAAAPFWRDGGTLYVHVMLPHPPGNGDGGTLEQDYAANLKLAAAFSGQLAARLDQRFGSNYLMVVTADHPLRLQTWCRMWRYQREGCIERSSFGARRVPLYIVGHGGEGLMECDHNLTLLTTLAGL